VNTDDYGLIRSDFIDLSSFEDANEFILKQVNIQNFFSNQKQYYLFMEFIRYEQEDSPSSKQWGDGMVWKFKKTIFGFSWQPYYLG